MKSNYRVKQPEMGNWSYNCPTLLRRNVIVAMMMILCPKAGSLAFTPPGDEMSEVVSCCLPQSIMGEQLVQGRYAVAWGRFEPATFRLQGTEHTPTPPRPIDCLYLVGVACSMFMSSTSLC